MTWLNVALAWTPIIVAFIALHMHADRVVARAIREDRWVA